MIIQFLKCLLVAVTLTRDAQCNFSLECCLKIAMLKTNFELNNSVIIFEPINKNFYTKIFQFVNQKHPSSNFNLFNLFTYISIKR